MNPMEFRQIVRNTPNIVPVFKLKRCPVWMEYNGVQKGDLFYYNQSIDTFTSVKGHRNFNIGLSYLKFMEYSHVDALYTF